MIFASKEFQIITPASESDQFYQDFEFMLIWAAPSGGILQYLFSSWENSEKIDGEALNSQTTISRNIEKHENFVLISAEDISLTDLNTIKTLLSAKDVYRLFKDGSTEKVISISTAYKFNQTAGRYNIVFNLQLADSNVFR